MSSTLTVAEGPPVAPAFEYEAFISYRRSDGKAQARALRQRLLGIRVPSELTSAAPNRRLRVYLDQIYERATDDFFEHTIKPALRVSRHLVVVQSPSAAQRLSDGRLNWLEREIEYFRSLPPDGRSISVAVTFGDLAGALPGRLHETHPNIERHDLRRWRWYRTAGAEDELVTLAATLHDIRPADMPVMRQEDARRRRSQRRTRVSLAATAAVLVVLAGGIALRQSAAAREAVVRRNTALAATLWNRLDFSDPQRATPDELNALWALVSADAAVRAEFLDQLPGNPLLAARLGRGREWLLRAMLLRWPSTRAQSVYDAVLAAVDVTSDDHRLQELSLALLSAATILTPQQAQAAFPALHRKLTSNEDTEKCGAFEWGLRGLASQLPSDTVAATFMAVVNSLVAARADAQVASLGSVAQALAQRMPERDTTAAATVVLDAFPRVEDGVHQAALALSLIPLEERLTTEQIHAAFDALLKSMDGADADELSAILPAMSALSARLSAREASAGFAALIRAVDVANPETELLDAIGTTALVVAGRLDPRGARTAFAIALRAIAATSDREKLAEALGVAAGGAALEMSEDEAGAAYFTVRGTIFATADAPRRGALTIALHGLGRRLSSVDADTNLFFASAGIGVSPTNAAALALASAPLADRIPADKVMNMLDLVMDQIRNSTDASRLSGLRAIAQHLAARLGPAETRTFAAAILTDLQRDKDLHRVAAFGAALDGAADRVTSQQADALLPLIVAAVLRTDILTLESWAGVGAKLAVRMSPAAAASQFPRVVAAIQEAGTIPQYDALTAAADVMAEKVSPALAATAYLPLLSVLDQTASMANFPAFERIARRKGGLSAVEQDQIRSRLAWATTPGGARVWAEAIVRLLPRADGTVFVTTLVDALKFPTSAGDATNVLLDGIRSHNDGAPGAAAGLAANLAWIGTTYPAIDLSVPPACQGPPNTEFVCPAPPLAAGRR